METTKLYYFANKVNESITRGNINYISELTGFKVSDLLDDAFNCNGYGLIFVNSDDAMEYIIDECDIEEFDITYIN